MPEFSIGETDFLLDGRSHRILSGALHYFRVHPEQWADRIHKARLMGLNTIETYVAWNAHSPEPGEWQTDGGLDLGRFLDLVHAEGMHAIVRPGPYICAEWHNGGLPAWLFRDAAVGVRTSEPRYLAAVTDFLERVYEIVVPRQIDRGGPVVMVQIENEYGAYGSDADYLRELVRVTREAGITTPLNSIDQPTAEMLEAGSIPGLHKTGSFGSRSAERLATLREHQSTGPLMCMEFWDGWFDSWGTHHHTTSPEQSADDLDILLAAGGSVNIYMFHGGTNFGLTNGANDKGTYQPIVTSYDYDAPLDEAGHPTAKFHAFREVIARYAPVPDEVPEAGRPTPVIEAELDAGVRLDELAPRLGEVTAHDRLPSFDDVGFHGGLAVYETTLENGASPAVLSFGDVRDRARVLLDGRPVGILSREAHETALPLPSSEGRLTVLVEDQGRVNYERRLGEHKGLIGDARLDGRELTGWSLRPLDLERVPAALEAVARESASRESGLARTDASAREVLTASDGAVVARAAFELDAASDLHLDTTGWGKGFAWINGFLLGRYWRRGPQQTLFVPAPVTRAGANELIVLELEVLPDRAVRFVDGPRLGQTDF